MVKVLNLSSIPSREVLFIVRRIGMTKPPVKLGVGKKFLKKRKEPPSDRMKLVWQP